MVMATHIAGSILSDLSGSDMFNTLGTAPAAKLVSISLVFDKVSDFPPDLGSPDTGRSALRETYHHEQFLG